MLKYLFKKHKELETISIWLYGGRSRENEWSTEDEKNIVLLVFSNIQLRYISVHIMKNTGDIVV